MNRAPALTLAIGAWLALAPGPAFAQAALEAAAILGHSGLLSGSTRATGRSLADRFVRVAEPISGKFATGAIGSAPATAPRKPRRPATAPGALRGAVREKPGGRAVPGLAVTIVSTDPVYEIVARETVTDSAGRFAFEKLDPGPWLVAIDPAQLPARYAAPRLSVPIDVARSQEVLLPAFELSPGACAAGLAEWEDGYPLTDAELLVAPRDTLSYSVTGSVPGDGQFALCGVPADTVMVWVDLGDGRHLGAVAPLAVGDSAHVRFHAAPLSRLAGTLLWLSVRTADGRAVPFAEIVVSGRREASPDQPALVYLRKVVADRDGSAEFALPSGRYRILAMNPREGEWARLEDFEVGADSPATLVKDIAVGGTSTKAERIAWTASLFGEAESAIFLWHAEGMAPRR